MSSRGQKLGLGAWLTVVFGTATTLLTSASSAKDYGVAIGVSLLGLVGAALYYSVYCDWGLVDLWKSGD